MSIVLLNLMGTTEVGQYRCYPLSEAVNERCLHSME